MPPFFGLMRKAGFYQRTAGSSSSKEPQEAPRESQCVQRISPGECRFRPPTKDLHREAQIVQSNIRQQESYRSEAPSGQSRPASYLEYSQETASAPFMNIDSNIPASLEPSTHAADFAQRVRVNQAKLTSELRLHYDFIICGSGSSGSVVARRLAENPDVSVLLLEAGGTDDVSTVMEAGQWPANLGSDRDWGFQAQPNPNLNGRSIPENMGKVLGGGSSINAMVWARGHKNDWDYFASEAGDPAWSYESVLNIYRQIEDWHGAPDPKYRGTGGPVFVQHRFPQLSYNDLVIRYSSTANLDKSGVCSVFDVSY
jgi:hypothetical protein